MEVHIDAFQPKRPLAGIDDVLGNGGKPQRGAIGNDRIEIGIDSPCLPKRMTGRPQQHAFVISRVGGIVIMNQAGAVGISRVIGCWGERRRRES
jgi:hypothetical protein